ICYNGFSAVNAPMGPLFCSCRDNTDVHSIRIYYIYGLSGKGARAECSRSGEVQGVVNDSISSIVPLYPVSVGPDWLRLAAEALGGRANHILPSPMLD